MKHIIFPSTIFRQALYIPILNGYNPFAASWSPDGQQIAFTSPVDGDHEIYVVDVTGENIIQLTDNDASDAYPSWSPDGSRIAFCSNRDGNMEIYIMSS